MRSVLKVLLAFVLGTAAIYAITAAGMLWYMDANRIFDRDGGMAMAIIFGIAPLTGLLGGVLCAIAVPLWRGRDRARLGAGTAAAPAWPLPLRMMLSALLYGGLVYLAGQSALWLMGSLTFGSYFAAFVVAFAPSALAVAAALLAAARVRRKARRPDH
jgi:hypothetical protein